MPTRGAAPYLEQAIESVLAQTQPGWSLFISENGPGELEDRVKPFLGDERVRFSPTGEDLGAARNHTRLLEAGTAPYVAILHDDDRWDPEWLARRVDFLERHPECGFVFGGNREIDGESRVTASSELVLAEGVHQPEEIVPLLVRHNIVGIPTVLARLLVLLGALQRIEEQAHGRASGAGSRSGSPRSSRRMFSLKCGEGMRDSRKNSSSGR